MVVKMPDKNQSKISDSLRDYGSILYANIKFSSIDNPVKTVTIASTIPAEGKTSIAIFLAMTIAEQGKSVLIIDGDFRRPRIGRYLGKRFEQGFFNYIVKEASLDSVINATNIPNVYFMDCGYKVPNSIEIFESDKFTQMIRFLREKFDFVLIDTPPLSLFIDAAVIAPRTDGTILVCGSGQVSYRQAQEALEQLRNSKANVLGCVLNKVSDKHLDYGFKNKKYLRYYGYVEDKNEKKQRKKK